MVSEAPSLVFGSIPATTTLLTFPCSLWFRWVRWIRQFNGSIVSDCDAIKDVNVSQKTMTGPEVTAAGLLNGCDQDCGNFYGLYAAEALDQGLLNVTDIDLALERIFLMRFKLGEFGDSVLPWSTIQPDVVGCQNHANVSVP
jgi:beta-glucosidase